MKRFASVVLVDPAGRLLMQERDEHAPIAPECWAFPGGHVEPGESAEAAAYRELAEETGVELEPGTLAHLGHFGYRGPQDDHEFDLYFTTTDLAEVDCHEGRQMVFVDPAEIGDRPLSDSTVIALPAVLGSEAYRALAP